MRLVPCFLQDLSPGSIICADSSIPCIAPGPHQVQGDTEWGLYIPCRPHGQDAGHFLDGQLSPDGSGLLLGLWNWKDA